MEDDADSPQQAGKRPRPVVSCLSCRRMKLKCDRRLPCERCIKAGRSSTCAYAPGQEPSINGMNNEVFDQRQRTAASASVSSSVFSFARFEELQARVMQLERALQAQNQSTANSGHTPVQTDGLQCTQRRSIVSSRTSPASEKASQMPSTNRFTLNQVRIENQTVCIRC